MLAASITVKYTVLAKVLQCRQLSITGGFLATYLGNNCVSRAYLNQRVLYMFNISNIYYRKTHISKIKNLLSFAYISPIYPSEMQMNDCSVIVWKHNMFLETKSDYI